MGRHLEKDRRNMKLLEEFKAGTTIQELSIRYGIAASYVRDLLTKFGATVPRPILLRKTAVRNSLIIKEYQQGYTISQLARRHKVSRQRIHQIVNPVFDSLKKITIPNHLKAARQLRTIEKKIPSVCGASEWLALKNFLDNIWHACALDTDFKKYGNIYYGAKT